MIVFKAILLFLLGVITVWVALMTGRSLVLALRDEDSGGEKAFATLIFLISTAFFLACALAVEKYL